MRKISRDEIKAIVNKIDKGLWLLVKKVNSEICKVLNVDKSKDIFVFSNVEYGLFFIRDEYKISNDQSSVIFHAVTDSLVESKIESAWKLFEVTSKYVIFIPVAKDKYQAVGASILNKIRSMEHFVKLKKIYTEVPIQS